MLAGGNAQPNHLDGSPWNERTAPGTGQEGTFSVVSLDIYSADSLMLHDGNAEMLKSQGLKFLKKNLVEVFIFLQR